MKYVWLFAAILSEVVATSCLKASDGFTRLLPSAVVVLGYATTFFCMSKTVRLLPIGVVYAVWSGVGTVLITLVARVLYKQVLDRAALLGMALIVLGLVVMNACSRAAVR